MVLASETDQISDRVGFRTIKTRGTDILLNDRPVFLRGICIHEENPMRGGRAYSVDDARMLLGWAKELNANFVRLAHYPHNEHMARVADELGGCAATRVPITIDLARRASRKPTRIVLKSSSETESW